MNDLKCNFGGLLDPQPTDAPALAEKCTQPAGYQVTWGASPDDYNHACEQHIFTLIPDGENRVAVDSIDEAGEVTSEHWTLTREE